MLTLGTGIHALAMLGLVVALILGLGWVLRRYGTPWGFTPTARAQPRYKISQRLALSAQHTLIELETPHGTRVLVLGPQGAVVVPQPKPPAALVKAAKTPAHLPARPSLRPSARAKK